MQDDYIEVYYDESRWRLLRDKRMKAVRVMEPLSRLGLPVITHGSIARGDVKPDSDVDIVIVEPPQPFKVDLALEQAGLTVYRKVIIQATPSYTPKVYYYLDYREEVVVSYPLAPLRPREREFYKWGGEVDLNALRRGVRVPGVDKRLKLIIPREWGHVEYSIIGREAEAVRVTGVSMDLALERVRVLTRRRLHGRTGVFLEVEVEPETPVEDAVRRLIKENKYFRRRLAEAGFG